MPISNCSRGAGKNDEASNKKKTLYKGVKVGKKGIVVNLLQFVDDTLFVCDTNKENLTTIKTILICFELTSGLRVNYHKTRIGGMGIGKETIQNFSRFLNCSQMKVPLKYLGMPIGDNP